MGKVSKTINPDEDGVRHINMYSQAKTPFGKMLSDFAHYEFDTENDGHFSSVEAYWYYMSLPETVDRDSIRNKYGYQAKAKGRELRKLAGESNFVFRTDFEECILKAIRKKVRDNKKLFRPEYKGLPIIHYYCFKDGTPYDVTEDFPWLIKGINQIVREECY